MRRIHTVYTVICVALVAFALQSCQQKRNPGLDNERIVIKPYTLFVVDDKGKMYSTNDGERFTEWTGTQGVGFIGSVFTSGHRVLFRAPGGADLHVTEPDSVAGDNLNSNPSYKNMNIAAFGPSTVINLPNYVDTYSSGPKDRLYVASGSGKPVAFSDYNGNVDSVWWHEDAPHGLTVATITSFARLANGVVVAYDDATRKIFTKSALDAKWQGRNSAGLPAPGQGKTYIISKGNDIAVVMVNGDNTDNGIWVSGNEGDNFGKQPDIVDGANKVVDITCATGGFGKVLIAATDSNGIWRLGGQGAWERTYGLKNGTKVHAIVSKHNVFKNESAREYIYAATNTGLYRSDDLGQNWIRLNVQPPLPGVEPEFVAIH